MEQMQPYPYYPQPMDYRQPMRQQMPTAPAAPFQCIPVSGREEALSIRLDFSTRGALMPDLAHGHIYVKTFNEQTGNVDFSDFAPFVPEPPSPPVEYLTVEEFNKFRETLKPQRKPRKEPDDYYDE